MDNVHGVFLWCKTRLLICFFILQEGLAFAHCTTCKAPYHIRVHGVADRKWRTLKFRFFVTRDILFIFFTVQMVLFVLFNLFSILFVYFMLCSKFPREKYGMTTCLVPLLFLVMTFIFLVPGYCSVGIFGVSYWWFPKILAPSNLGFW